jgi:hypothetical protein
LERHHRRRAVLAGIDDFGLGVSLDARDAALDGIRSRLDLLRK